MAALYSTSLLVRQSLRSFFVCRTHGGLLIRKLTTDVPPPTGEGSPITEEGSPTTEKGPLRSSPSGIGDESAVPPPSGNGDEGAAPPTGGIGDEGAAPPPSGIGDEGAAPPTGGIGDEGVVPPPSGNGDEGAAPPPPPPDMNPDDADEELREQVLRAAIPFVGEHGWTQQTLSSGAESLGLPTIAHGMFPKGGADLINFFYQDCNAQLSNHLAQKVEENQELEDELKPSTRYFIQEAVQARLEMLLPVIDKWPQAMAIQAQPQNACQALNNLGSLVDEIWFHAGDKSTDFNWYTKRLILAGVYKSTEVFMIQDKSEDYQDTWIFLDNRFNNVAFLGQNVKKCKTVTKAVSENFTGVALMVQNILGVNSRVR